VKSRARHQATCAGLCLAFASIAATEVLAQAPSINQRRTSAEARIGGSRLRNGSFRATGTSGVCGEIPKEASLTGTAVFSVEFPNDGPANPPRESITSISFGSKQLVGGVTRSALFTLNVSVVTADGGKPPAYVLHTDSGDPKVVGTATLINARGVATLHVVGQEVSGETIDLTVTCAENVR